MMRSLAYLPPLLAWAASGMITLGLPLAGLWLLVSVAPGVIPLPSAMTLTIDRSLEALEIGPWYVTSIALPGPCFVLIIAQTLAGLSTAFLVLLLLSHALSPLRRLIHVQGASARVPKDINFYVGLSRVATGCGQKMPSLWLIESNALNARAMAAPGGCRAVVLTTGLVQSVTDDELRWVFAHELAHLRYGDAAGTSLWLASLQWSASLRRTRAHLLNRNLHAARRMSLICVIYPILVALCHIFVTATNAMERIALAVLVLLRRSASRRAEFRADRFAATHVGKTGGIHLLGRLSAAATPPPVDLVGTHPSAPRRIAKLQAMTSTS